MHHRLVKGRALLQPKMREVEQHDAVLHDQPDQQDQPHRGRDVEVGASGHQQQQGAAEGQRSGGQDQRGRGELTELDQQDGEDQHAGHAKHDQQFAKRLPLRGILPAHLERIANRQLGVVEQRPNFVDAASQVAILEPGRDERHRPQVFSE